MYKIPTEENKTHLNKTKTDNKKAHKVVIRFDYEIKK